MHSRFNVSFFFDIETSRTFCYKDHRHSCYSIVNRFLLLRILWTEGIVALLHFCVPASGKVAFRILSLVLAEFLALIVQFGVKCRLKY